MRRAAKVDLNQAEIVAALRAVGASVWVCAGGCGKTETRSPSRMEKKMCSPCRFIAYQGVGNPNYSNAGEKRCLVCGVHFISYNKTRIYCSMRCYGVTRIPSPTRCPQPPKVARPTRCPRPQREPASVMRNCLTCTAAFKTYKRRPGIYCSYQCHLDSGGAWRAGMASKKAIMKYGAKRDANHGEIVGALQAYGVSVIDTSHIGQGFPDLVLGWCQTTLMMEIKNPKTTYGRKGLNKNQLRWQQDWRGGPYAVVSSVDAAISAVKAMEQQGGPVATLTDVDGALRLVRTLRGFE